MSQRLKNLLDAFAAQTEANDDRARLRWLNQRSFRGAGTVSLRAWSRCLNRIARRTAETRRVSPADAWFHVANTLAASVPDPKDNLYGIRLAAFANQCDIVYDDAESYARLFAGYARIYPEWEKSEATDSPGADAMRFYDFVGSRLSELGIALTGELENDEFVSADLYANPDDPAAAAGLLWDAITHHVQFHEENKLGKMSEEEVDEYIAYGGHYLWAARHARLHDIERDELTRFVCVYPYEWFKMMDVLLRRDLLEPGVLDALVETTGSTEDVCERGINLVSDFRAEPTKMTLTEYLNASLTAVAHDA